MNCGDTPDTAIDMGNLGCSATENRAAILLCAVVRRGSIKIQMSSAIRHVHKKAFDYIAFQGYQKKRWKQLRVFIPISFKGRLKFIFSFEFCVVQIMALLFYCFQASAAAMLENIRYIFSLTDFIFPHSLYEFGESLHAITLWGLLSTNIFLYNTEAPPLPILAVVGGLPKLWCRARTYNRMMGNKLV